jgi:protein SCO1/2
MKAAIPIVVSLLIAAALATAFTLLSPGRDGGGPAGPAGENGVSEQPGGANPLEPSPRTAELYIPTVEEIIKDVEAKTGERIDPAAALIDHNGKPVTEAIFDGKVTIVDFIFTHCPAVCPMMTDRLELATEDLAGTPVRFVSISMDPEHDTPERLREYAGTYGADLTRWTFLTGDERVTRGIASKGLKFGIEEDPTNLIPLPDGSMMPNIMHGTWFALIGPDRRVLDLFQSSSEDDVERLEQWARRAAAANGA